MFSNLLPIPDLKLMSNIKSAAVKTYPLPGRVVTPLYETWTFDFMLVIEFTVTAKLQSNFIIIILTNTKCSYI